MGEFYEPFAQGSEPAGAYVSGHSVRWWLDRDTVYGDVTCHEPPDALCRMACLHGCEALPCGHELLQVSDCSAVEWFHIDGDMAQSFGGGVRVPVRDAAIHVSWEGDQYLWTYLEPADNGEFYEPFAQASEPTGAYVPCPHCQGGGRDLYDRTLSCARCGGVKVAAEQSVGVIEKYTVRRNNDPGGKHDDCWYFVLDIQHDPHAQKALLAYADAAATEGYQQLRDDLYLRVMESQKAEREAHADADDHAVGGAS